MPKTEVVFEECMEEMFRRVGVKYSRKFCEQENWFRAHRWTQCQENEFRDWMISHLRKRMRWTKKLSAKEVGWFLLTYGWQPTPGNALVCIDERQES